MDSSIAAALIQFAVFFLPAKPVDVMSDGRTYDFVLAPRCPDPDFMAIRLGRPPPYVLLARISNLIINEVRGINRAVYDI